MIVQDYFVDKAFDAKHQSQESTPRDLQQLLAHEADHLMGFGHIPGNPYATTHSAECSGL